MTRSTLVSSPTQAIRGIAGYACDTQRPTIGPASSWRLAIRSTLSRRARTSAGQGGGSCRAGSQKGGASDLVIGMAAESGSLRALRNRAIILLGFAGAFRRSELVALDVKDLEEVPKAS
jgi:hypothetical protein